MWRASRSSVHTRRLCVCVPREGASLWRVWVSLRGDLVVACLGCPGEGTSLWCIWVSARGGFVRAGCLGGRCKSSCMVSSVRVARRRLTTFHREVTAFGGTYPGSWLSGHQEIFSFQCVEGFSWRKQGDMGGYPTDVLSNGGEAMSCVSISIERLQKDKRVTVSVDRGRWAAQALKSHGAGKLGLFSEHLHAVRRKGFKCSAWIGIRTLMLCSAEAEDPLRWGKSVPNQARSRFVLMANQL